MFQKLSEIDPKVSKEYLQNKFPNTLKAFDEWLQRHMIRRHYALFIKEVGVTPGKFYELPFELQYGVFMQFFQEKQKNGFNLHLHPNPAVHSWFQAMEHPELYKPKPHSKEALEEQRRHPRNEEEGVFNRGPIGQPQRYTDPKALPLMGEEREKYVAVYVIFDHSPAYPNDYICRRQLVGNGIKEPFWDDRFFVQSENIDTLREMLTFHFHLHKMAKDPKDDPSILEVYV
jgi:hypothetical protein